MDPIGPGNHERAWNDPPKFAFNSSGTGVGNPSGRRRLLNKRVPVPIGPQANSPLPQPLKPGDGPPIGTPPKGPPLTKPPTSMQLGSSTGASPRFAVPESTDCRNSEDKLEEVETLFKHSLENVSKHLKDNVREEITKRFDVMKTMWLDGKLSEVVQNRMVTLMKAIKEENFDEAWSLHQGLIVDFTSTCSPWMVGVKSLVIETRNHRKNEAGNKDLVENNENDNSQVPMVTPIDISKVTISDKEDSSSIPPLNEDK